MDRLPLEDITILDLGAVWAGPLYTEFMADMGAKVIRLESLKHIDIVRGFTPARDSMWPGYKNGVVTEPSYEVTGTHHNFNRNKYGITLDFTQAKGQEIFKRLVRLVDIVTHNLRPGFMEKFGLGYPALKKINPGIIMIANSGYGQVGPEAKNKAYGHLVESMSSICSFTGYPEPEPPMRCGIHYGDVPGPVLSVGLTLAALHYRRKTGKGQILDLSEREAVIGLLGEAILGYSMNQTNPQRLGNHHSSFAPYNVYPVKPGPLTTPAIPPKPEPQLDEHWIAIAVRTDAEWRALCHAMDEPAWSKDDKFSTSLDRWHNQDDLDKHIAEWTSQHDMYDLMFMLQKKKIPAGGVFDSRDLSEDPHLKERNFWVEIEHPLTGKDVWNGIFCKLSKTPGNIRMPAPLLGQHNEYVYKDMLGISDEEYEDLLRNKCIGFVPLVPGAS